MNVEIFSLCDAATDQRGRLNILGAFDTIWVKKAPIQYPQFSIALRIRFLAIEQGVHSVNVHLIDFDGNPLVPPAKGEIQINFPDTQRSGIANLILNFQQVKIPACGNYSIDLTIDGESLSSIPLLLKEVPKNP